MRIGITTDRFGVQVAVPGTGEQLEAHDVTEGFKIMFQAHHDNVGYYYLANSKADVESSTSGRVVLSAGQAWESFLDNTNRWWVNADNATDILAVYVERK